jgi:hypothetical protein
MLSCSFSKYARLKPEVVPWSSKARLCQCDSRKAKQGSGPLRTVGQITFMD